MTDWKEIKDEKDIELLLKLYGHFHDGCLREVHIVTRESVNNDLSMVFDGQLTATLLFQRQYKNPTAIELRFDNVDQFNFNPPSPEYDSIIYNATFKQVDNLFYWADEDKWEVGDNDATWISGERVYWRERPQLIGQVNRLNTE
ncbi:MAG: hypothetical protein JNN04_12900 [Cyclobacteriaceae bacterium]|nr:hypothetical protein [Cyclobacteriaceae bacterium]